jgi:hypothetical protein
MKILKNVAAAVPLLLISFSALTRDQSSTFDNTTINNEAALNLSPANTPNRKIPIEKKATETADTPLSKITSAPGVLIRGNQIPTHAKTMRIDYSGEPSTNKYPCANEGGLWTGGTYSYLCLNQTFTAGTVVSQGRGPLATLFSLANADGATGDIVAVLGDTVLRKNGGSAFGANFIARTEAGASGILRGMELDIEPAAGTMATAGSGGLLINAFSSQIQGAAIQMGGLGGGSFQNGIICAATSGSCFASQTGQTSTSLIDSTAGAYTKAPIVLGTGAGQSISFGGKSFGMSPHLYSDATNNLIINLGSGGYLVIQSLRGAHNISFDRFGRVSAEAINLPSTTPATSTSSCSSGDVARDANFIYVCVTANTWKRASLSSW